MLFYLKGCAIRTFSKTETNSPQQRMRGSPPFQPLYIIAKGSKFYTEILM